MVITRGSLSAQIRAQKRASARVPMMSLWAQKGGSRIVAFWQVGKWSSRGACRGALDTLVFGKGGVASWPPRLAVYQVES